MSKTLPLLLVLLLCAVSARADGTVDRNNELSFKLGGYGTGAKISINGEEKVADGGGMLGLRYLREVGKNVGVGVEFNGLNAGEHESSGLITNANSKTTLSGAELLLIGKFRFRSGKFKPYLLGGLGLASDRLKLIARPRPGSVWTDTGTSEERTLIDSARGGLATLLEAGADYRFNDVLAAGAFLGLHMHGRRTYAPTALGQRSGLGNVRGGFSGASLGTTLTIRF